MSASSSGPHAPRIAWFSPLRPSPSGIAHYSEELLPVLATAWEIDVYVDGEPPGSPDGMERLRVRDARAFQPAHQRDPYDAVIYQVGNNPAHAYVYEQALAVPGILVLHDAVLHHLRLGMLLERGDEHGYRALMERSYGAAGRDAAARVLAGQAPEALFDFPLTEEIVAASRLIVVHSEFSRTLVQARYPSARVLRVPHAMPLPPSLSKDAARRELGLAPGEFIIGSVTHVNPSKRFAVVLRALRWLREAIPARLVVAGTISESAPVQRLSRLYDVEGAVSFLGFVDDRTARQVLAASDVVVNLRYPTAGETSGSLLRAMAAGRPVLVTDIGAFREVPDGAVVKVPPDALEEETVTALLRELAERPELRELIGRNARDWIAREHSFAATVTGYQAAVAAVVGHPVPLPVAPGR